MHSQLPTFTVQIEVSNPMDFHTTTITTTKKPSFLSKRGQHKKVCWGVGIVDNEDNHTIRKDAHLARLSQQQAQLKAIIADQNALTQRQVEEVQRLKGLWVKAQPIGAIPEEFER
jgi:hypothetical protein